eukprot:scaffold26501_cov43-Prasinocladus_malaysianus.AAC.1
MDYSYYYGRGYGAMEMLIVRCTRSKLYSYSYATCRYEYYGTANITDLTSYRYDTAYHPFRVGHES